MVPVLALLEEEGVAPMVVRRIIGVRPVAEGPGSENRTFFLRGVLNWAIDG